MDNRATVYANTQGFTPDNACCEKVNVRAPKPTAQMSVKNILNDVLCCRGVVNDIFMFIAGDKDMLIETRDDLNPSSLNDSLELAAEELLHLRCMLEKIGGALGM